MTDVQEFCLRWNNHQSNLVSAFHDLRQGKDFVDVTLACDGCSLLAHRVVLSACSPFFRDLLKTTPCKHPVIVLKDISFRDLVALVEFMYQGEVRVDHDGLPSFLRTAEVLRVRGLTEDFILRQKAAHPATPFDTPSTSHAQPPDREALRSATFHTKQEPSLSPRISTRGINVANWASSVAEVKMEDTEVNSRSSGVSDGEREPESTALDDDRTQENETVTHPSLTLQSFARIPPLIPQDFGQDLAAEMSSNLPPDDRRQAMDIPPSASDQDFAGGGGGRPPGRSSTSDRPRWPCPFCLRLLSSRSSVRRHIEDKHTDDTSRHPCPLCERLYRTRNSLQYHLSTAHRDREPGPRGRPRTRSRTPLAADATIPENDALEGDTNSRNLIHVNQNLIPMTRGAPFGLPPT